MLIRWRVIVFRCVSWYFSFESFDFEIVHWWGVRLDVECLSRHICIIVSNVSAYVCVSVYEYECVCCREVFLWFWLTSACLYVASVDFLSKQMDWVFTSFFRTAVHQVLWVCVCVRVCTSARVCVKEFGGVCVSVCTSQTSSVMHMVTFQCEGKWFCRWTVQNHANTLKRARVISPYFMSTNPVKELIRNVSCTHILFIWSCCCCCLQNTWRNICLLLE